jgi:hypothetical protein
LPREISSPEIAVTHDSQPRSINARQAVRDIEAGLPDHVLMEKYRLSERGLRSLIEKLVAAGLLRPDEHVRTADPSASLSPPGWKCPACGKPRSAAVEECPDCGVIVEKYRAMYGHEGEDAAQARSSTGDGIPSIPPATQIDYGENDEFADELFPEPRQLDRNGKIILLTTPLVALICFAVWWFGWTLTTLKTLVHEMGHTIFGWFFGYPSLPAFDVVWGGGVTLHTSRNPVLLGVVIAGFAALFFLYRGNRATLVVLALLFASYLVIAFTSLHSMLILFMGHGTELLIAGIFLYRALSGRAVVHAVERPLYAIVGFFLLFSDLGFAYRLMSSAGFREEYACAKGGCIDMDFVRIATEFLNVKLTTVAGFFFLCCLAVPVLAFLAFRYESYIFSWLSRLLTRRPEEALSPMGSQ